MARQDDASTARERDSVRRLRRELADASLIGRATGVLMQQTSRSAEAARQQLIHDAAAAGRTLAQHCAAVLVSAQAGPQQPPVHPAGTAVAGPARPGPPVPHRVVTADPEEARRQLCAAYGTRIRMTAPSPGAVFRLEYTDAGAFRTGHHRLPGDLVLTSEAAPQVVVADLRGGAAQCRYVGGTEDAGPGDVFLSGLPATSHAVRTVDAQVRTVALPLALVYRAAGHVPDQADPPHFTALRPAAPALGDRWRAAAAFTADLLGHPEAMTPLVAANAAHLLAATALAVFPNTATEPDPAPCDTADAAPAALRRAITFIEDNAYRDITLAEIADSAYVTPRALQYAFRRHLGTTPLGYLRDIRLHHAHHDLVDADPATTTVSQIAARWGFLHPGRFAALYRRAYHCPPSSTLHV